MPYIRRDSNNQIMAVSKEKLDKFEEFLEDGNLELDAFLSMNNSHTIKEALKSSDKELARITEDMIHLLIQKKLILFTELPPAVQKKLLQRERLRSELHSKPIFLDEDGTI